MQKPTRKRVVSLALVAIMLPVGVVSPGVCHAHADGDRPHRHVRNEHSHQREHGHHNSEKLVQTSHHRHHDGDCALARATSHAHVNLLGFHITLPVSDRDGDRESEQSSEFTHFVIAHTVMPVSASQSTVEEVLSQWTNCASALDDDSVDNRPKWEGQTSASSIPLCDSARRERSGVLVI
jgi:hypothetical protein